MSGDAVPAPASAAQLNTRHALADVLTFREDPGGLVFADVNNARARASVCLQGAQLTLWWPHTQSQPVLWLSGAARYAPGKAIRGGIPVCWPWFGSPADRPGGPAHGFARTQPWQVQDARAQADGATCLRLRLTDSPATRALWPAGCSLELEIVIGDSLDLVLTTGNTGTAPVHITEALHSYFLIGDIATVTVQGLAGASYFDAAAHAAGMTDPRRVQAGSVHFDAEVDRVYDSGAPCWIDDPHLQRRLHITTTGSASTVVWNPWEAKAQRLGDMGDDGWRRMVCVESGNARENGVVIAPGGAHRLAVHYDVASQVRSTGERCAGT